MVILALIALDLVSFGAARPAVPRDTLDFETILENFDESDEQSAFILERLEELRRRPIDLNSCSAQDLLELPFLSESEAEAILGHRARNGPFATANDVQNVPGLEPVQIERLLPFVTTRSTTTPHRARRVHAEILQRWTRKLELSDGFQRDSLGYEGDPNVLQTRLALSAGPLSARMTMDKDAGEPITWTSRASSLGFDFMSGHVAVQDVGWIRKLVLGDFSPRFGHGVLLSAAGDARAGAFPSRSSLRPYASAGESGHFRGVAAEAAPSENLVVTAYASRRKIDAAVDTTGGILSVSRRTTGLHRTVNERDGREAISETAGGGSVAVRIRRLSLSAALLFAHEKMDGIYDRSRRSFSLGASLDLGPLHVSTEVVPSTGMSATVDLRTGRRTGVHGRSNTGASGRIALIIRHATSGSYQPTSVFARSSTGYTRGSTDLTLRGRRSLGRNTTAEFTLSHTTEPDVDERRPFPSSRSSADLLVRYSPNQWITLSARGTERRSEARQTCADVYCMEASVRRGLRLQIDYRHSRKLECRLRAEYVEAVEPGLAPENDTHGLLVYQELRMQPSPTLQLLARLAMFSADDHAARIYSYENDLTYAFASPSFSGRGRRSYILARWRPHSRFELEMKASSTSWEDVTEIGSGRDRIEGSRSREIRVQIRLRM